MSKTTIEIVQSKTQEMTIADVPQGEWFKLIKTQSSSVYKRLVDFGDFKFLHCDQIGYVYRNKDDYGPVTLCDRDGNAIVPKTETVAYGDIDNNCGYVHTDVTDRPIVKGTMFDMILDTGVNLKRISDNIQVIPVDLHITATVGGAK